MTELYLAYNSIGDEGVIALAELTNLCSLDLSGDPVRSVRPLLASKMLKSLNLSYCRISDACPQFWEKPTLSNVYLFESQLGYVPREELSHWDHESCLERLCAYFHDLAFGAVDISDTKFMILGNGRIGKTQICRRLRGEPFDPQENSTHGIRISSVLLPCRDSDTPTTTLKIWDFGGQDIYLGTHALFLRSRAIFPVVWTESSERNSQNKQDDEHGGLKFRPYPLEYWVRYVAQMGGTQSPILIIQNQCDGPSAEALRSPVCDGALRPFAFRKPLIHYSAKTEPPRGHETLLEALCQAVSWLNETSGIKTGVGRMRVKKQLEEMQQNAQAARETGKPNPELCWISSARFLDICEDGKDVSEPDKLLEYLHQIGTVFYRKGLFDDRIVIDQQWALNAIYAVFDRASGLYGYIRDKRKGRFTAFELAGLLWDKAGYDKGSQQLFLSMMRSCGICFQLKSVDEFAEYVAPDLLPVKRALALELEKDWDRSLQSEEASCTYKFLPPGLLRGVMARVGEDAGLNADYWRDGFYFYDGLTASRALVEQKEGENWGGSIIIQTQKGNATALLKRLCEIINREQERLGVEAAITTKGKRDPIEARKTLVPSILATAEEDKTLEISDEQTLTIKPTLEPSSSRTYYVSYAWGGKATEEERRREEFVNKLCEQAKKRGIDIIRDRQVMHFGDSISRFMNKIASGDKIFVVLSEKYIRSPFCMYELHEIYREARGKNDEFLSRIQAITLPDAKIYTPQERIEYARYWQEEDRKLSALI